MKTLKRQYEMLMKHVSLKHVRSVYNQISWDSRLVGIKGARGVGKTTLMLQRIALAFPDRSKALYVSLDDLWFGSHNLMDLAYMAEEEGITHLFLDEVHRLPGWEQQIKNVYDFYPTLRVVFTGSSMLEIDHSIADLSRRCLLYSMPGLSFREFLSFEGVELEKLSLSDILYNHTKHANDITQKVNILPMFNKYLIHGYYPFYKGDSEQNYLQRVCNIITTVIDYDIPAIENVEYATLLKTKQLLSIMASQSPSPLKATKICDMMGITKNQLIKLLSLLNRSMILRLLYYNTERNPRSMTQPQKVLMSNTSILYALGEVDKGKVRESFMASMLAVDHLISYPKEGDLLVDSRYLFEIGGAGKGFAQIRNIPDSFLACDDIECGFENRIPLWIFGFLY